MAKKIIEVRVRIDRGKLIDTSHAKRAEANGNARIPLSALKEHADKYFLPEKKEKMLV